MDSKKCSKKVLTGVWGGNGTERFVQFKCFYYTFGGLQPKRVRLPKICDYFIRGSKIHHPSKQPYTMHSLSSTTSTTPRRIANLTKYPPSTTTPQTFIGVTVHSTRYRYPPHSTCQKNVGRAKNVKKCETKRWRSTTLGCFVTRTTKRWFRKSSFRIRKRLEWKCCFYYSIRKKCPP